MKDMYELLNSPQIAEHCRKLQYPFTVFEQAVLIHHAGSHVLLEERISLYRDLEKDTSIPKDVREAILRTIANDETAAMRTEATRPGILYCTDGQCYSSFARAKADILSRQMRGKPFLSSCEKQDVRFTICEMALDGYEKNAGDVYYAYHFNADGNLYGYDCMTDESSSLGNAFAGEDIFIPLPFQNGDILTWMEGTEKAGAACHTPFPADSFANVLTGGDAFMATPFQNGESLSWTGGKRKWGVYAKRETHAGKVSRHSFAEGKVENSAIPVYAWMDKAGHVSYRHIALDTVSALLGKDISVYPWEHLPQGAFSADTKEDAYRRLVTEYVSLRTKSFSYGYPGFCLDRLLPMPESARWRQ